MFVDRDGMWPEWKDIKGLLNKGKNIALDFLESDAGKITVTTIIMLVLTYIAVETGNPDLIITAVRTISGSIAGGISNSITGGSVGIAFTRILESIDAGEKVDWETVLGNAAFSGIVQAFGGKIFAGEQFDNILYSIEGKGYPAYAKAIAFYFQQKIGMYEGTIAGIPFKYFLGQVLDKKRGKKQCVTE